MEKDFDVIYWNVLKAKLKMEYPLLTNADLQWRHGTKEDLLKTIAVKLGKRYKEVQELVEKE